MPTAFFSILRSTGFFGRGILDEADLVVVMKKSCGGESVQYNFCVSCEDGKFIPGTHRASRLRGCRSERCGAVIPSIGCLATQILIGSCQRQ